MERRKGIMDKIQPERLKCIAIDEAHLIKDWKGFRQPFSCLARLRKRFSCPIVALSATLTPENLEELRMNFLRDLKG